MSRRTGLGWVGTLAMGLGSLGVFGITTSALAAPMTATLDGSGALSQQTWQTAYLMSEGNAEAKVVGPLNRGARLEIDPARSSDQYWFVKVPDSPGGAWQGYVWKDFVKVGGAQPAASPSPKVAPMADSLAQKEAPKKAEKPVKVEKADKPAVARAAPDDDEPVVARPRVELDKIAEPEKPAARDPMVAYDPEMFEVSDPKAVKAKEDATDASEGWDTEATKGSPARVADVQTQQAKVVPPKAAPAVVPEPEKPAQPVIPVPAPVQAAAPAPARATETEVASPVRQIQVLREQIERELESMPQTALTGTAAQNVDGLVTRLNEVLKVERSMLAFLESTTKMVEAHDRHIQDLQQRVTTLSSRSPERVGMNDEVTRLRKRLDELSATVSTTRQHAKRIDALEAQLRKTSPVSLEPAGGRISADHGAIVLSDKRDLDRRTRDLEKRLTASRKRASQLADSIQKRPARSSAEIALPKIDARDSGKALAEVEEGTDEGVEEIPTPKPVDAPPPMKLDRVETAKADGRKALENGAGLESGTVAAMLKKLRDLREQRRREREGVVEVTGSTPPVVKTEPEPAQPERADLPAVIGSGSPPETEEMPDDMREDEPSAEPASVKKADTTEIKENRRTARRKRMRLATVENLLSARL